MARPERVRRRGWRWLGYAGAAVAGLLVAVLALLQTSFARERIRAGVNSALSQVFQGKIELDRLGSVTLWGVTGINARVFDARGQQVVSALGLSVRASFPSLLWQLVAHGDHPQLEIVDVHVAHADVQLREDEDAGVTLASTFLPRETAATPSPPSAPDAGPRLNIPRVTFDSVWVHGRASGSPDLDADLKNLRCSLKQSPTDGFALDLKSVELVTRNLPLGADPHGKVTGIIEAPANDSGPLRLEVTLDGAAAGSPLALEASWVGDDLHARVMLLRLPASFVNQPANLALDGDLTFVVDVDGPLPQLDFSAEIDGTAAHVRADGYAVVADGMELGATVTASRVDLARVVAGAPTSALELRTEAVLFEVEDRQFVGGYRADLGGGRVEQQTTPPLWLTGKAHLDTETGVEVSGKLGVADSGISVLGQYRVSLPQHGHGLVTASLQAALDDPARLAVRGIRAAGRATLTAELDLARRSLAAKASVSLSHVDQAVFEARNVEVRAQLSGTLDAPQAHAAATLDLLSGRAHADLDYSPTRQTLDLFVADVDLLRLAHVLGVKVPIQHGTLGLDAHVRRQAPSPNFVLDATANADLGQLGGVQLVAKDFELPSAVPSVAHVGALKGEIVANGKVELEAVSPLLTAAGLPIERTTGHVRFELAAKHRAADAQGLELSVQVDTNGLRIVQQRKTPQELGITVSAIDSRPVALEGIDLHLAARTWPKTGDAVGTVILRDAGGTLLVAQAEAQLADVWPHALGNLAALARVPLKATLQIPERRLQSLPPLIRPAALRGRLQLDAQLEGSAADPRIKAQIVGKSLRAVGSKEPVDVAAELAYAPDQGDAHVNAKLTRTSIQAADAKVTWQGDLRRAAELSSGATGLSGSADVTLADFPLDVVPQIVDREVNGRVSGDLKLDSWGKDAHINASLRSTTLVIGKVALQELTASARTDQTKVLADVGLKVGRGTSHATLEADMQWGKRALPELGHRGSLKLLTSAFELETLAPLLGAYVSELGGVLDANTEVVVTPDATMLSGSAKLQNGAVQLPAIGQRFSDITARVAVRDNQFKLEQLDARGTTGRISVKGAARLDGFQLRGANAQVTIKKNEALPLTLEGAAIGDAWGNINATFVSPAQGERRLDIDVATFHLTTPDSGGYGLQSLDEDAEVRVGVRRADGVFVPLPVQPLQPGGGTAQASATPAQPLRIVVKLGNDVVVERGRTAQAQLAGQLTIVSAQQTEVDGRIEVRGGKLDVQGKTFEIERGVVTFEGNDPGNPTVTATARWDAPGYTVYADYVGDVKNGRIKLHTEPPLQQDEIANLLLFGTPEGSAGGSSDQTSAALAVGVAGDTAAKGLNQVLDNFTKLDVSARIDTTTGSARPELVFQVSPRVSAKVTRVVGTPTANQSPDLTFLTLELRLKRSWALSALFGDHGASALDLIWRRRY